MTDPYKVLGVEPTATDEQIKSAYRELAKKYHPDANAQSSLADLAEEKMKEINEAYDAIMNSRRSGAGGSQFTDIRSLINSGRTIEAEELLDGVPESMRDAEWYFLKGSIMYLKGWLDQAYTYFSTACRMNPASQEYAAALNRLNWQRSGGMQTGRNGGYRTERPVVGCSPCDVCCGLMYADCCCECLGGDFIGCC